MIISHSNRFIFFAVPKTATHSIRSALQKYCANNDWQQQALFRKPGEDPQLIPIKEIAAIEHGHISARQIRPFLDKTVWTSYFKFGFVRNPYDRFVSVCAFLNRQNPEFKGNALPWMKSAISHPRFQQRVLVRPQYQQLISADGEISLDFVGKYEQLQSSFDKILQRVGLDTVSLETKNSSKHSQYHDYYDAELQEMVTEFYQGDLERFDYAY